jgi:hypothetical protein
LFTFANDDENDEKDEEEDGDNGPANDDNDDHDDVVHLYSSSLYSVHISPNINFLCVCVFAEDSLLRKGSLGYSFVLNHNQGTAPVQYNAAGWLRICRDNPISKNAPAILQDSKR